MHGLLFLTSTQCDSRTNGQGHQEVVGPGTKLQNEAPLEVKLAEYRGLSYCIRPSRPQGPGANFPSAPPLGDPSSTNGRYSMRVFLFLTFMTL